MLGSGIAFAQKVAEELGPNVFARYFKNFGTAMVKFGTWELEFVGARRESYRVDSRKPIVENGSLSDDQKRRDFTINAMSISLQKNDFGELYDPFNGLQDIEDLLKGEGVENKYQDIIQLSPPDNMELAQYLVNDNMIKILVTKYFNEKVYQQLLNLAKSYI